MGDEMMLGHSIIAKICWVCVIMLQVVINTHTIYDLQTSRARKNRRVNMTLISNKIKEGREKKKVGQKERIGRNKSVHINGPNKGTQFSGLGNKDCQTTQLTINK